MVGGPDSVPDFLKEDEEPAAIQEPENMQPMDGGPDSVPDFLKEEPSVTPAVTEEPMVGGPESVPDFLKEDEELNL